MIFAPFVVKRFSFDQDPPHRLGGGSEEMAATIPVLRLVDIDQSQIHLMNQTGRLERLAGRLAGEPLGGQTPQLVVDQRKQLFGQARVALLDRRQDSGHFGHERWLCL